MGRELTYFDAFLERRNVKAFNSLFFPGVNILHDIEQKWKISSFALLHVCFYTSSYSTARAKIHICTNKSAKLFGIAFRKAECYESLTCTI